MRYYVRLHGREHVVEVRPGRSGVEVLVDGVPHPADLAEVEIAILEPDGKLSFITEDHRRLPKDERRFD